MLLQYVIIINLIIRSFQEWLDLPFTRDDILIIVYAQLVRKNVESQIIMDTLKEIQTVLLSSLSNSLN
jgi:hypothetical protein